MAANKRTLVRFNIKNLKYAMKNENDTYETPKPLAFANSLSLEADFNEVKIYGDGQVIAILPDDKGFTGTLSVTDISPDYEIDCGRAKLIQGGIADIQQLSSKEHALYYELDASDNGTKFVIKTWLFGVFSGKPSESYQQSQDDPSVNFYDYPINVVGTNLMDASGTEEFTDENGNTFKVTRLSSFPDDPGYDTFGNAVPIPKEVEEIE